MKLLHPLILLGVLSRVRGHYDLDNSVIGSPVVRCEKDYIHFSVPTKKPFNGRVYVKGEHDNPHCVKVYEAESESGTPQSRSGGRDQRPLRNDFSEKFGVGDTENSNWEKFLKNRPNERSRNGRLDSAEDLIQGSHERPSSDQPSFLKGTRVKPDRNGECPLVCPKCEVCKRKRRDTKSYDAELDVQLGACNTRRDRIVNPPGMHVSFVVVVSFHDSFVTKLDRAYKIQCAYEESDRTVTAQLDVSMPQTVELSNEMQTPRCKYSIKNQHGKSTKSVQIGDVLEHEWSCESAHADIVPSSEMIKMFGILVHDCYVDDGQNQNQLVIDSHGCSTDQFILPTPTYSSNSLSSAINALVVKFPDRELLGYKCAISICMREAGHCDEVTPPKCDGTRSNRTKRHIIKEDSWMLTSPQLTVLDLDLNEQDNSAELMKLLTPEPDSEALISNDFCVSVAGFAVLIASSTFMVTVSLGAIIAMSMIRPQKLP